MSLAPKSLVFVSSLCLAGCDALTLKEGLDALGVAVDVTGTLRVSGDGVPEARSVTLYAPSKNEDAFDDAVCDTEDGVAVPGCYGRIQTGDLDTPVEADETTWDGDDFIVHGAILTSDLAFVAVLNGTDGASCSQDIVGFHEASKIVDIDSAITLEFDGLETDLTTFPMPRDSEIHCDPFVDGAGVEEADTPKTTDDGEDLTGTGEGWSSFTLSDGLSTADASTGAVKSADNPIDCGGAHPIAPVLTLTAECTGCGTEAFIRTQVGSGTDAIYTTVATDIDDGLISTEISLPGGYAVVQLDTNAELDGVGESHTITFCEPDDTPAQEIWVNGTWDEDATDIDLHVTEMSTGGRACWYNAHPPWGDLDIDDTDGYGPENIKSHPEFTSGEYEVRVHYYSDHGLDRPTNTTVRVVYVNPMDGSICDVSVTKNMVAGVGDDWWSVGMFGPGLACPN
jgi:hypothetical protein